uniref:RNA polymerase b' subunit n=1 Tax=Lithodesmioides polymorpha TaxID=1003075 RepID=UPI0022370A64|nr:RNA polymerase b' subunit [Lithodesmioides polymorpha]UYC30961.1 RNA polymerase b' subunit [Lithodesmioides polymorpha]
MTRSEKEFDYIKIKLASPIRIFQWSHRRLPNGQFVGEVQKSETINYRTFKPEMDGLFCERIFGPSKSFECACGKYKRVRYDGLICERCGVELTESRVRRHRMGHINLIYPVTHVWYINSRPNYMALLLEVEQCEKTLNTAITWLAFSKYILSHITIEAEDNKEKKTTLENYQKYISKILTPELISELLQEYKFDSKQKIKRKKSGELNLWDGRIKRIKLSSLAYFIAEDEISFYGLHWDLQKYRRCRALRLTGYPLKPYAKPKLQNRRRNTPKYLLRTTPHYLIGAVLIKKELERLNLNDEINYTRNFITCCSTVLQKSLRKWEYQRIYKLQDQSIKRIRILENLLATGSNPAWMIITILPVIPPALRPMIQLEGGRFATSDLNELYRRIITRNNRLLRLLEIDAPQLIIRNEKRMLQEAVDTLIDNGKRGKIALSANNRPLKSLSDIIKGKHGRFRQNLLGKRVDYSGRSVIVVGPSLKLNQCGLPYEMAIELFQPFIIRELINQGFASNMKIAKNLIQQNEPTVDSVVEKILANHPIFLNRAPTLHRLGIQAFEPILVQGRAIKLHPLVCSAFNADFDGDQMAVHLPLSLEAQAECYMLMLAPHNFLSPANGEPIIMPSQDMVLGCYYLTVQNIKGLLGSNHYFTSLEDVILAYNQEQIELHATIWIRYTGELPESLKLIHRIDLNDKSYIEYYQNIQIRKDKNDNVIVQYLQTTTGRVIFNYTIQKTLNLL